MENYAAGIIPYTLFENQIYFLLGRERSNDKWSGFVGSSEPNESIIQTALREFNEETSLVFKNHIGYFLDKCSVVYPVTEKTPSGNNVYLWFIECPKTIFFTDLDQLIVNQSFMEDSHYKEKSELRWFRIDEISKRQDIFYRLKRTILKQFS